MCWTEFPGLTSCWDSVLAFLLYWPAYIVQQWVVERRNSRRSRKSIRDKGYKPDSTKEWVKDASLRVPKLVIRAAVEVLLPFRGVPVTVYLEIYIWTSLTSQVGWGYSRPRWLHFDVTYCTCVRVHQLNAKNSPLIGNSYWSHISAVSSCEKTLSAQTSVNQTKQWLK